MNNFRDFRKKTIIQGLETDSSYSSDFEDYQKKNQVPENHSNPSMSIDNQNSFESHEEAEEYENIYEGCSEETISLLKTRKLFNNPAKRLLSIWPSIYL